MPSVPASWRQSLLAACIAGGKQSAASFRAAAQLFGLPGGEEIVEITCPRHRRAQYGGVVVHESHHLTERDLMIVDLIPVTRVPRTLCDLAGLVELGKLARDTLDLALLEAVRRDLVDVRSVWAERDRLGGDVRLGGEIVLDALQRFVPPERATESTPESRLLQLLRALGLLEPVPQFWIGLLTGERIRLDFAFPELQIGIEFDPYKFHGDRDRYELNSARTLKMQAIGWERVSVTDDELDAGLPNAAVALQALISTRSSV